jgi:thiol-disulfide isomerase/thioredoxin
MTNIRTLALAALLALSAAAPHAFAGDPPAAPVVAAKAKPEVIYDDKADAAKDIDTAIARAKRNHTRVLVQWGANWCGWCKKLHATCASDKDISKNLRYEYEVVLVDIGQFNKHIDLATKYGADLKKNGVPFLTVLGDDGAIIANQDTGPLEDPKLSAHDVVKVLAFLSTNQAPTLKADEVLAAGIAQAKADGRLVFLHFGAPWCGWCHKLEDWMAKPEIAAVLSKAFVDVKIDTDRMTGGQLLLDAHAKGKSGGIPWCEFIGADGVALANSNGPDGNIGFPAQTQEIAWFVKMLKVSNARLSAEDTAILENSLSAKAR